MGFLGKESDIADVSINGVAHNIRFSRGGGKYELFVDGLHKDTFRPDSFFSMLLGDLGDYEISIDGAYVVIAMRFGRMRVSVDGVYADDGSAFAPVLPLPKWSWGFVVAGLLPPMLFSGTFLDFMTAICFVYVCTHFIIKNPDLKKKGVPLALKVRVIYCFGVTAISWTVFALFKFLGGGFSM